MKNVLVSTFELLFARQIAQSPLPTPVNNVSRRVIQGYFLTIANLEDKEYRYRVELRLTPTTDPQGLPLFVTRVGTAISPPAPVTGSGGDYRLSVTIPGRSTGIVGLFPATLGSPTAFDPTAPEYQARGYVSISLPPRLVLSPPGKVKFVPQSKGPVSVLVTPDLRGTFLPNGFPPAVGDLDFDQTFSSLPIAGGKAQLEIEPSTKLFSLPSGVASDLTGLEKLVESMGDLSERDLKVITDLLGGGEVDLPTPNR